MSTDEDKDKANPELKAVISAKGWLTRVSNSLNELIKSDPSKVAIETALDNFNVKLAKFEEVNSSYELTLEGDEFEKHLDSAHEVLDKSIALRTRALEALAKFGDEEERLSISGSASTGFNNVKLPKLELKKFAGNVTEWTTFWDNFSATVDRSDLPSVTKFSYLQSLLEGEARRSIDGLSLSDGNYETAVKILEDRFGRKELVIFSHIQSLLAIEVCAGGLYKLKHILDQVRVHVRSLESLGISGDQYGVILTPLILSRLPSDVRLEWAREGEGKEGDLNFLLHFMKQEIERRERAYATSHAVKASEEKKKERFKPTGRQPAAVALNTTGVELSCTVCKKGHKTGKCPSLVELTVAQRYDLFCKIGACFKCLKQEGHVANDCESSIRCFRCKGNHHKLFCKSKPKGQERDDRNHHDNDNAAESSTANLVKSLSKVVLQMARVEVVGPKGIVHANLLFDTGSDRTYVTSALSKKLGLKSTGTVLHKYAVFGGDSTDPVHRPIKSVTLKGINTHVDVNGLEVPKICAPIYRPTIPNIPDIKFAPQTQGDVEIDLLVGSDFYWSLMKRDIIPLTDRLVCQDSVFGYIVSGSLKDSVSCVVNSTQLLCLNDIDVKRLWEIEDHFLPSINPVIKDFEDSIRFEDGRYTVSLPWKGDLRSQLSNNKASAEKRLESLTKKLRKEPELLESYNNALKQMESQDVIEEVDMSDNTTSEPIFYLPHRPVIREQSVSTKVRPVFDGSAKDPNGLSLNECLETGPSLLPDLIQVLLRFRRWSFALTADISKAFLQIRLNSKDKDVHRFLWNVDVSGKNEVREMRFTRVTFGIKSSPFLLNATIDHHLSKYPQTRVVEELKQNLYVDDFLSGADTLEEVIDMYREADRILSDAGMKLAKWKTNCFSFKENLDIDSESSSEKILGVTWSVDKDCFSFSGLELAPNIVVTKRVVLSFIARIFDPLGLLNPFIMTAKILFQKVWQLGLDWDIEITDELVDEFTSWIHGFELIKSWYIPRRYASIPWSDGVELHAFGDASERGYGCCIYLKMPMDGISLVISKARVAPLKKITLPRLELLGSLMAARLLNFVKLSLNLPDARYCCWTDSMAALGWIRGDPNKWKQFVSNRVTEIQDLTDPANWHHCPGVDNPADLLTRGLSAAELIKSEKWLHGPTWLSTAYSAQEPVAQYPIDIVEESEILIAESIEPNVIYPVERSSDLCKCIRICAYVLRFIRNVRDTDKATGPLSYDELVKGKLMLVKQSQTLSYGNEISCLRNKRDIPKQSDLFKLSPFLDEDGLLRVQGRLQMSNLSYSEKHPIILPKDHLSKLITRFQHKLLKHAGVSTLMSSIRNSYWIVGLRRIAKTVIYECITCQRQMAKACNQDAGILPKDRVTKAPPFSVTGVDYAGPIYCEDFPKYKFYICLLTCAVTRAVHLELAKSLSAEDFSLCFRRFASRRGIPRIVYSDNGTNFIGAQDLLKRYYGPQVPNWKFIIPKSPWWGGWWERLVRSVKGSLKKTIGKSCITRDEMETLLSEVEFCVNSRPLTFVGDDIRLDSPLTPNHFLLGKSRSDLSLVEDPDSVSVANLEDHFRRSLEVIDRFWKMWSNDYLRNLPHVVPHFKEKGALQIGAVVLIQEDNIPRLNWVLGRIIEVYPGRDGKIRSAKIQTCKGSYTRPVQRLHKLEFITDTDTLEIDTDDVSNDKDSEQEINVEPVTEQGIIESPQVEKDSEVPIMSKYGRRIKGPIRLDL